jgi:hypothetical protein
VLTDPLGPTGKGDAAVVFGVAVAAEAVAVGVAALAGFVPVGVALHAAATTATAKTPQRMLLTSRTSRCDHDKRAARPR